MKTELIEKAEEVKDQKGNHILVSKQKLIQENGSETLHYIFEKFKTSDTGVPQGRAKTFWVPSHMIEEVISAVQSIN